MSKTKKTTKKVVIDEPIDEPMDIDESELQNVVIKPQKIQMEIKAQD